MLVGYRLVLDPGTAAAHIVAMIGRVTHLVTWLRALGLAIGILCLAHLPLAGAAHARDGAAMDHVGASMALHPAAISDHPVSDTEREICRVYCLGLAALPAADPPLPGAAIRATDPRPTPAKTASGEAPAPSGPPPKPLA